MQFTPDSVAIPHSTGIKIIIVGLGIAGLTAAVECHRKGHTVIAFERSEDLRALGDSIAIGSNATRILQKWDNGKVMQHLSNVSDRVSAMEIHDSTGEFHALNPLNGFGVDGGMIMNRGELVMGLYRHAKALGVDMRFSRKVTNYWEDDAQAGVILGNGDRVSADCVIGSDGVYSRAREAMLGDQPSGHPSGFAVYRAFLKTENLMQDPSLSWIFEGVGEKDRIRIYIGDMTYLTLSTGKQGENVMWHMWHRDNQEATESWTDDASVENALKLIDSWPMKDRLAPLMRQTPTSNVTDFQLRIRDPLPTWISGGGRMMVLGDAAHPVLPVIGQGGGQGIEDAGVLAAALELAGKSQVRLGLQVVQKIRHQRASAIQEKSCQLQTMFDKPDWDAVKQDPSDVQLPPLEWIHGHDAQRYTYDEFAAVVKCLEEGVAYTPTNIPE
ncbi:hypothetical protein FE257_010276 [Aspergillus nanangensis]|uniref:FAD-binding domain-containing protein n=1 Tax=Aspergillus nanangensis TaxID=2582783 RepID=A0AAD4CIZ2_ASPNN|nr:hypothetical protein FE257_010276 [Aspergillus nanangensis]